MDNNYLRFTSMNPRAERLLLRFRRPSSAIIDGREFSDMAELTHLIRSAGQSEPIHIVMAGTDSFTANSSSFARIFAPWNTYNLSLAISDGTWQLYKVEDIAKTCQTVAGKATSTRCQKNAEF